MNLINKFKRVYKKIRKQGIMSIAELLWIRIRHKKSYLKDVREMHIVSKIVLKQQSYARFHVSPRISIITPLYNTPDKYLKELLVSLQNQTYRNWELCLADGSDEYHKNVQLLCEKFARLDSRIKYKRLEKNEGIVGNTNRCIEIATGDYLGLLDHDDLLHPSALFEVVNELQKGAEFVYTDEMKFTDKVDNATDFICKSGFGLDELRAHNYICHFVVFRRALLDQQSDVYRADYEGSQDYDMVLRLIELTDKIVHIPKILYYWRVHDGSVSQNLSVKQYAVESAKKALKNHLKRVGLQGKVECNLPYETIYRIKYNISEFAKVSIIIWSEDNSIVKQDYIKELLNYITYENLEIIVDDLNKYSLENVDIEIKELSKKSNVFLWLNEATRLSTGTHCLFLNNQCQPIVKSAIEELLMYSQREDVFAVGPHITYNNNKTYFGGAVLDSEMENKIYVLNYNRAQDEEGYEANLKHVKNTTALSYLCFMVSKGKFNEVGGFNQEMTSLADIDVCLRGKDKYANVWTCYSIFYYSGKKEIYSYLEKNNIFEKEWKVEIDKADEFCHPFLKRMKLL